MFDVDQARLLVEINPLQALWVKNPWRPSQAHNGYLKTYLNIGRIGLFMLVGVLIATYRKSVRDLQRNFEMGRFRLGFLAPVLSTTGPRQPLRPPTFCSSLSTSSRSITRDLPFNSRRSPAGIPKRNLPRPSKSGTPEPRGATA